MASRVKTLIVQYCTRRLVSEFPVSSKCLPWVYESQREKRGQPLSSCLLPWPSLCLAQVLPG